jgi:hypothetical protein
VVPAVVAHLLAILALLASVLSPLAPVPAAAQQAGSPPPLPAPQQVAVVGSFQTAIGCAADYDPSCPQTQLAANGDNTFSAFVPVPPGDWAYRIVATSDQQRSLGEGGVPDAADLILSVPEGSAGAVFAYDANTGEIVAEPVANRVELATDLGDRLPLLPTRGGGYGVTFGAQPGTYGFQILVDGEPVAQDQISLDQPRRVVVETDEAGQVALLDTLRDAALTVTKTDDAGGPLPGACFAVSRGDDLLGQACDADDGAADGQTRIRFPDGIEPGAYDLAETLTPDGEVTSEPQRVDLGPGEAAIDAVAASTGQDGGRPPADDDQDDAGDGNQDAGQDGGQDDQQGDGDDGGGQDGGVDDGEEPGVSRLVVRVQDAAGDPLPGACAELVEFAFEACDDDGNGAIVFGGLLPGGYTVRETVPPAGLAPLPDQTVDLGDDGGRVVFRHDDAQGGQEPDDEALPAIEPVDDETPTAEPTEDETPAADADDETGTLDLRTLTAAGDEALGACFAATNEETGERAEACDSGPDGDGASDNGVVQFLGLPPGRYAVEETTTPAGFAPDRTRDR